MTQARFQQIESEYRAFLQSAGLTAKVFIPVSARQGDNIAARGPNLPWWEGPTVLETLDSFVSPEPPRDKPLRFPVQDVYRFDHRRILAGRVESGTLKVGDRLLFSPGHNISTVKTIERWNAPTRDYATAGESIGITLTDQIFVERGAIAAHETSPPCTLTRFKARIFWLGKQPFAAGPEIQAQAHDAGSGMRDRLHRTGHRCLDPGCPSASRSAGLCGAARGRRTDAHNQAADCL